MRSCKAVLVELLHKAVLPTGSEAVPDEFKQHVFLTNHDAETIVRTVARNRILVEVRRLGLVEQKGELYRKLGRLRRARLRRVRRCDDSAVDVLRPTVLSFRLRALAAGQPLTLAASLFPLRDVLPRRYLMIDALPPA